MDGNAPERQPAPSHRIDRPAWQTAPVVLASPHSGRDYRAEFVSASRLDLATLRRSEDSYVDELFAFAPDIGAPLLAALFPRAFIDPNREAYELDPTMFEGTLPSFANVASNRVAAGLGTVARVVASGDEIYGTKLRFDDVARDIEIYYRPYHAALQSLIEATRERFGHCVLIDCHSMPSTGAVIERDAGVNRVDIVLGDAYGASCAPVVTNAAEQAFRDLGYAVARNAPYSGGFTTRHYGRPHAGTHALQIEINRRLYMDEATYDRRPYFATLSRDLRSVVTALAEIEGAALAPAA